MCAFNLNRQLYLKSLNKRPVNTFLCLQAACVEDLVLTSFEVTEFDCVSLSNIANARDGVLLGHWLFEICNEQSPDALASGLWNGEFGGDLLSHG